jgi:hypothetical protein
MDESRSGDIGETRRALRMMSIPMPFVIANYNRPLHSASLDVINLVAKATEDA